jgi:hypothetical protein
MEIRLCVIEPSNFKLWPFFRDIELKTKAALSAAAAARGDPETPMTEDRVLGGGAFENEDLFSFSCGAWAAMATVGFPLTALAAAFPG